MLESPNGCKFNTDNFNLIYGNKKIENININKLYILSNQLLHHRILKITLTKIKSTYSKSYLHSLSNVEYKYIFDKIYLYVKKEIINALLK